MEEKAGRRKGGSQVIGARNLQGGEQTYIVGGVAISEHKAKNYTDFADEMAKREKNDHRARKKEATAREFELGSLLASDLGNTTGAKYLEALHHEQMANNDAAGLKKLAEEKGLLEEVKPRPFSAQAIRLLGCDPTLAGSPSGLVVESGEEGRKRVSRGSPYRKGTSPKRPAYSSKPLLPSATTARTLLNLEDYLATSTSPTSLTRSSTRLKDKL